MSSSPLSTPIAVEEKFQQLKYNLSWLKSNRLKVVYLTEFMDLIYQKENPHLYQSYYQELLPYFLEYTGDVNLNYLSVELLIKLNKALSVFTEICALEENSSDLWRASQTIKFATARTFFYLGEWGKGLSILYPEVVPDLNEVLDINSLESEDLTSLEIFESLLREIREKNEKKPKVYETLQQIKDSWKQIVGPPREDCIWTLLLEQNHEELDNGNKVLLGNIQALSLKLTTRPDDADEDLLLFNNRTMTFNDLIHQQAQDALTAARNIFFYTSSKHTPFYKMLFSFPDKNFFYTGDSVGLAMGLLSLAALSFLEKRKYHYKLEQAIAVTGPLDMLGQIRPIDENALKTKLEALFYSPFASTVLPDRNQQSAENIVRELQRKHAKRNLKLLYIEKLDDAIEKSDVVVKEKITWGDKINKRVRRKYLIGLTVVLIVLLLGGQRFLSSWDRMPRELKIVGNFLKVFNAGGKELWHYEFQSDFSSSNQQEISASSIQLYSIIDDLDGDQDLEVLFGIAGSEDKSLDGSIYCFSASGDLLWRFHDHPRMIYGVEEMDDYYRTNKLISYDFEGDGQEEIIVVFTNIPWYPCRLAILNTKGEVIEEYWHSGYISCMDIIDIDQDGTGEIVFGGTNNDYDQAILGILEYGFISGHSPVDDNNYKPQGITKGTERYYLRFPHWSSLVPLPDNARMNTIYLNDLGQNQIRVKISSSLFSNPPDMWYRLTYDLKSVEFGINDGFYLSYFLKYGHDINEDFTDEFLQDYFSKPEYWNGEKWVTVPIENRYWQEISGRIPASEDNVIK